MSEAGQGTEPSRGDDYPKIAILCGKGNNAGDGFVIARHLLIRGAQPVVVLLAPPDQLDGDARQNFDILQRTQVPVVDLSAEANLADALQRAVGDAVWLVDAMLGTGAVGQPREPIRSAIEWMNTQPSRRLAIDVPSGLDCDTGQPASPTLHADHTCTFVAPKLGFSEPGAAKYLGQLHVVSLGIDPSWIDEV